MKKFPAGVKVGGSRRWAPGELTAWEQAEGIEMPPPDGMLNVRQAARRYGVSVPTIWRWRTKGAKA